MKCPVCDETLVKQNLDDYDYDCPRCQRGFRIEGSYLQSLFCADKRKFKLSELRQGKDGE
jgi:Zn-finger nucleic acid-binding protein